ncbi:MAG: carboxypeptidase-like regulatory domain-containing protein, partial [Thermoanaerobaculia bacterium]
MTIFDKSLFPAGWRACAMAIVLYSSSVFAQTTSSLTGTVTGAGQPLAGVRVTITSPELQGTRTAVTGTAGGYDFATLPPGEYQVSFERTGFVAVKSAATL